MYETGNQENCNQKRIVLRDTRRQRGRDEARSMAQCAECTGCRDCICRTVPCHCTGRRTRGINLNIVPKYTQRPAGRCCFYRRFVCFKILLLGSDNDNSIYQSKRQIIRVFPSGVKQLSKLPLQHRCLRSKRGALPKRFPVSSPPASYSDASGILSAAPEF